MTDMGRLRRFLHRKAEEWIGPPFSPSAERERINPQGFDVIAAEGVVIYRCQDCTAGQRFGIQESGAVTVEHRPTVIGKITLRTPPVGWIMVHQDAPVSLVNRLLDIHRLRCPAQSGRSASHRPLLTERVRDG